MPMGAFLLIRSRNLQIRPNNPNIRDAFATALSRFEQNEVAHLQTLSTDSIAASTGAAFADLNTIAAAGPSDAVLQSDVQTGIANLSITTTNLATAVGLVTKDAGIYENDATGVEVYGSENLFGAGYTAGGNPFREASLTGLATDATSISSAKFVAPSAFSPAVGAFPGTDQIYVGSNEVPAAGQLAGPQVITLDYSALTQLAHPIKSLTLGIATDGFENPTINIPYTASINGIVNPALTALLNSLNDADRVEQYVSIGINPSQLQANKMLTITIDGPGDGVSGWAVDFLTVGVKNG